MREADAEGGAEGSNGDYYDDPNWTCHKRHGRKLKAKESQRVLRKQQQSWQHSVTEGAICAAIHGISKLIVP